MEMKIVSMKYFKKEDFWMEGVGKSVGKIYEKYLCNSLLLKIEMIQLNEKLAPSQLYFKKSDLSFN